MIKHGKDTILGAVLEEERVNWEVKGYTDIDVRQACYIQGYEAAFRVLGRRIEHVNEKFQEEMILVPDFWEALNGAGKSLNKLGRNNAKIRKAFVWGGSVTSQEILNRLQQQLNNQYEEPYDITQRGNRG